MFEFADEERKQPQGNEMVSTSSSLRSSFRPERTHLDVCYKTQQEGSASIFFISDHPTGNNGELVLQSGYIQAQPQERGLGTHLFISLSRVFSELSRKSGRTIVHPLVPSNERSKRFFGRHGYKEDNGQKLGLHEGDWLIKVWQPGGVEQDLSSDERELLSKLESWVK